MVKVTLVSALLAGCLVGCGSPPPPTNPAEEPAVPEPEPAVAEPVEPIDPDQTEMEITEPEATEPEATEPEEGEAEAAPAPAEPELPPCAELKESRCKVTQGCAWRAAAAGSKKGECIEHSEGL